MEINSSTQLKILFGLTSAGAAINLYRATKTDKKIIKLVTACHRPLALTSKRRWCSGSQRSAPQER